MRYFDSYPMTKYSGVSARNIMLGVRVIPEVLSKWNLAYPYVVTDNDSIISIAYEYYGSKDYAWLVMLSAQMIDPYYEWPLAPEAFEEHIRLKYGSKEQSLTTIVGYKRDRQLPVIDGEYAADFDSYIRIKYGVPSGDVNGIGIATSQAAFYQSSAGVKVSPDQWAQLTPDQQLLYTPVSLYTYEREIYFLSVEEESQRLSDYMMTPFTYSVTPIAGRVGYRPVYAYDYEFYLNERKRSIRLINRRYAAQIATELKERLNSGTRSI